MYILGELVVLKKGIISIQCLFPFSLSAPSLGNHLSKTGARGLLLELKTGSSSQIKLVSACFGSNLMVLDWKEKRMDWSASFTNHFLE